MSLTPVADALAGMLASVRPIADCETVSLSEADGRTVARDIVSQRTQPPFDASAMDGYAVRSSDLPGTLQLIGESAAGRPFGGRIEAGQCCRIFTGAVVPEGADAILIQEDARADGPVVTTTERVATGRYIRPAGMDFARGAVLCTRGDHLDPARLSLVAAAGQPEIEVVRRPRVALVMSGDELSLPGTAVGPAGIYASNGYGVAAIVRRAGGEPLDYGIVVDDLGTIDRRLKEITRAKVDVVVTLGGASVGEHDLIAPALRQHGVDLHFMKLAMRPGKPVMFGTRKGVAFLGLPGNPVSSLVGARVLLVPLLARLLGERSLSRTDHATLAVDLPANGEREHYMRAEMSADGVRPFENQDSSLLSVLARSDVLLVRTAGEGPRKAGETVPVLHI